VAHTEAGEAALSPHLRYVDEFIGQLSCASMMLELKLIPNAKELTETMAAFNAVRKHLRNAFDLKDQSVSLVSVGDGATPRMAALFAMLTKWKCFSVDPLLPADAAQRWSEVSRLNTFSGRIQDFSIEAPKAVVLAWHLHVPLEEALRSIRSPSLAVVACPCCNFYDKFDLPGRQPFLQYDDYGVLSPHRNIRIYAPFDGSAQARPESQAPALPSLQAPLPHSSSAEATYSQRYLYEPELVRKELKQRFAVTEADAAYLLKENVVDYFAVMVSNDTLALDQAMLWLRTYVSAIRKFHIPLEALSPDKLSVSASLLGKSLWERKEHMWQQLSTAGYPYTGPALSPQHQQIPLKVLATPPSCPADLFPSLRELLQHRPTYVDELRSCPHAQRHRLLNYVMGPLLKLALGSMPPSLLRDAVLQELGFQPAEFCAPEHAAGSAVDDRNSRASKKAAAEARRDKRQ
jgi:hypothetical protein